MKNTYFLDKIFNANHYEFANIIKSVVEQLGQEKYPHTYFKKDDKWIVDIEREEDLISIVVDDYSMNIKKSSSNKIEDNSQNWQTMFLSFLTKKQKIKYNKNLKIKEDNIDLEKTNTNKYIIL